MTFQILLWNVDSGKGFSVIETQYRTIRSLSLSASANLLCVVGREQHGKSSSVNKLKLLGRNLVAVFDTSSVQNDGIFLLFAQIMFPRERTSSLYTHT